VRTAEGRIWKMMAMPHKLRLDRRFVVQLGAVLQLAHREVPVRLEDLSLTGAKLLAVAPPSLGTRIQLSTILPPAAPITLQAEVIWATGGAMGVRFVGARPPRLAAYCKLMTRG
jgi:PilZ domain